MLVLTRKIGDGIDIGACIKVTVLAMRGNQVKLGIEAPAEISVYRSEITARIIEENRKAATSQHLDQAVLQKFWRQESQSRS